MSKIKITKKEIDRFMKLKGKIRGAVLKSYYEYILQNKGEEGVIVVEKRLEELGYSFKFKKVSSFGWYSESFVVLVFAVILEVFNWDETEAFNIGYFAPLSSFFTKILLRNLFTLKIGLKMVEKYWSQYSTVGRFYYPRYDIKKRWAILRIEDINWPHQASYNYIMGFVVRYFELTTKSKNVKIKQTKSVFWNDPYNEFKITW